MLRYLRHANETVSYYDRELTASVMKNIVNAKRLRTIAIGRAVNGQTECECFRSLDETAADRKLLHV